MKLPSTRLPVVPASLMRTPSTRLPEMMLPALGVRPADHVAGRLRRSPRRSVAQATAALVQSVPIKLPSTRLSVVPASLMVMPLAMLPEMRLPAPGLRPADHVFRCPGIDAHADSCWQAGGAAVRPGRCRCSCPRSGCPIVPVPLISTPPPSLPSLEHCRR